MSDELKLHDKVTIGWPLNIWGSYDWKEEPPILEIISFVTRSDGEFVRLSDDRIYDRLKVEWMRQTYLKAEAEGKIIVLATDEQGNPIQTAIIP